MISRPGERGKELRQFTSFCGGGTETVSENWDCEESVSEESVKAVVRPLDFESDDAVESFRRRTRRLLDVILVSMTVCWRSSLFPTSNTKASDIYANTCHASFFCKCRKQKTILCSQGCESAHLVAAFDRVCNSCFPRKTLNQAREIKKMKKNQEKSWNRQKQLTLDMYNPITMKCQTTFKQNIIQQIKHTL